MKRILALLLTIALLLSLTCGCTTEKNSDDRISVVCTVFPAYDLARAIAGDLIALELLIAPGEEVHTFDPTPQDMRRITDCDLFICNGGTSDAWADTLLSGGAGCSVVKMMECVDTLCAADHDHAEHTGHDHGEYDEHVWTSPRMAEDIIRGISDALCAADPENKETYRSRAESYCEELRALSDRLQAAVAGGTRRTLIFGDRFPMRYFTEQLGLEAVSAFPGCAADTEPSAATVAALIDRVKADAIPAVLKCELSSGLVADAIAEASGAKVLTLHSCHNVTAEEYARGETYLSLMNKNVTVLTEALK